MAEIDRKQAFEAIPMPGPILEKHPTADGGTRLLVAVPTRPLRRKLLRLPETVSREFELDIVGTRILEWCDGKRSVSDIVRLFSEEYGIHRHESERAVTAFFCTLVGKGVVIMQVPGRQARRIEIIL